MPTMFTFVTSLTETQIEKVTARSTTIDDKRPDELDPSTTQQLRGIREISTQIAAVEEETSVKLTSTSTTLDYYRNNFTGITNDDDDESVT